MPDDGKIYRGELAQWTIHHLEPPSAVAPFMEQTGLLKIIFTGIVRGDTSGRFPDGFHVRTSPLTMLDQDTGYFETKNSIYRFDTNGERDPHFPEDIGNAVFGITY